MALALLLTLTLRAQLAPPDLMLGRFDDDYAEHHTITASAWQHSGNRYNIVEWHTEKQFLIAQNDAANRADAGKWTRIDWMPMPAVATGPSTSLGPGPPVYAWAFCLSAYDAPTREAAAAKDIANRAMPKTGCNGFPFTRMAKAAK